jgi:hypothetical protein
VRRIKILRAPVLLSSLGGNQWWPSLQITYFLSFLLSFQLPQDPRRDWNSPPKKNPVVRAA